VVGSHHDQRLVVEAGGLEPPDQVPDEPVDHAELEQVTLEALDRRPLLVLPAVLAGELPDVRPERRLGVGLVGLTRRQIPPWHVREKRVVEVEHRAIGGADPGHELAEQRRRVALRVAGEALPRVRQVGQPRPGAGGQDHVEIHDCEIGREPEQALGRSARDHRPAAARVRAEARDRLEGDHLVRAREQGKERARVVGARRQPPRRARPLPGEDRGDRLRRHVTYGRRGAVPARMPRQCREIRVPRAIDAPVLVHQQGAVELVEDDQHHGGRTSDGRPRRLLGRRREHDPGNRAGAQKERGEDERRRGEHREQHPDRLPPEIEGGRRRREPGRAEEDHRRPK
jgi:hypothetical protein